MMIPSNKKNREDELRYNDKKNKLGLDDMGMYIRAMRVRKSNFKNDISNWVQYLELYAKSNRYDNDKKNLLIKMGVEYWDEMP